MNPLEDPIYFINTPLNISNETNTINNPLESQSLDRKCKWCGKKHLKPMFLNRFCDLVCSKLYSDNISEIINPDMKEYRSLYLSGKLDKKSKLIYDKCCTRLFQQLPTYKLQIIPLTDEEFKKVKSTYINCL